MLILGIETASVQVGCAVGGHEGVLASFHAARRRRHVEALVPAIEFTCRQAGVELKELGAIAVDIGPGLFSGLRVGVTTAKTLAQALRLPMIGVASLDLLAFPVRHSSRLIVPVIDARRGEVFYALYRQVPGGVQNLSGYQLGSPDDLASDLVARGEDTLLVGDGALRYSDDLSRVVGGQITGPPNAYPSAAALVALAHAKALREEFVSPSELEPLYLRRSDAELNWDATAGWGRGAPASAAR
ncbi:MAG TPA: tRNA (adenosine(37)-N6)-threonylcarbamoyltransferase complex dimerization subunit type 1 TsaB [Acidimicrobiales bacterium]|nr:tRNA (adenosine(37)-N6)-threonylcarbamoyltransferase complex dimerization subunit type 1 TsaB [Acidimicrobiales bacterium]